MESRTCLRIGEKREIFATLHLPLENKNPPIVVISHGFGSHKIGTNRSYVLLAEELSNHGMASLRFDYRGCGESLMHLSQMTPLLFLNDLREVLQFVKIEGFKRIGLFGSSLGGLLAVYGGAEFKNVDALVLWAPVASGLIWSQDKKISLKNHASLHPDFEREFLEMHGEEEIKKLNNCPVLLLHGDQDEVLSKNHFDAYREARKEASAPTKCIMYPETLHSLGHAKNFFGITQEIVQWYKETL